MNNQPTNILNKVGKLFIVCFSAIIVLTIILVLVIFDIISLHPTKRLPDIYYMNYDAAALDDSENNSMIKYGYQIFNETPKYIGPHNGNPDMVFQGNRLACKNCHLNSGTKPYSVPLIGIIQRFPQFRGRENKIGTIQDRINGCMERSMNGHMLPADSKEMKAIVKYLEYLSRYAPKDGNIEGQGFAKLKLPERAVNLNNGKTVFETNCAVCHTSSGLGVMGADGYTYEYPPLWGDDSFNHGAGMARVITAAEFIKANMPFGTTYDNPVLTDEEAYDVAGYINQQQRPLKTNPEKDFPDVKKKPVSTPYPPYADNFSTEQHQIGPFQPIMAYYKKTYNINKTK
ncbi:c-type cytochrome [Aestuariibaculum suncheonense]|uniref:C-type cytochrome n=1 Tax=Aestuariibaculum suncheonense TaxID=1028745 RepID=A0A8J6Q6K0_9FLAO|nr:c-type cytochrome [Aestuariibaculum suncheonense]MBD0835144.1 c-type cytochrome [Aestuariibaculum suncheonense]